MRGIRVGTRRSRLAMVQTKFVVDRLLMASPGIKVEVVPVKTLGDMLPPENRGEVEGKGAFTGDLEDLLISKEIDIAVHSMKDLPTILGKGLEIGATPGRADARDALVSIEGKLFDELPAKAAVGTSSIRRRAQLLALRRDIEVVDLHGNVETRVAKLGEGGVAAVVIAAAGLDRLGLSGKISQRFGLDMLLPAPCQGTIAAEARSDDDSILNLLDRIDDAAVAASSACERAFAVRLGGDCDVPAGFLAQVEGSTLKLRGRLLSPDGRNSVSHQDVVGLSDPVGAGTRFADELLGMGGEKIMAEISA